MATRTATLYQGENMAPTYDYTDAMVWEESEFGTRAYQGEGSTSTVVIRDPLGEHGNVANLPAGLTGKILSAKNLFVVKVGSDFLFRGRIGIKNYSRDGQHVERYRQVECLLHDTNWDLDHITVHDYSRPAETAKARAQGLIASFLSGAPRQSTSLNGSNLISSSNLVNLPAHTYKRTSPLGVLREVAESANKQFFVTGDTLTGGSLYWDGNDSTAYACTLSISDRQSEVNYSTVFPPIWNVGPASTEDGSEMIDEVYLFYGTGDDKYVTAHAEDVHTQYGHSSAILTDDSTESLGAAQGRANAILAHRQFEDKTYNVTIGPLTDAQVVLIKHGQTINIKARAIPDADDQSRAMRIAQCRFTTPVAGTWFAHLQLGRPWKLTPYNPGPTLVPKGPGSLVPSVVLSDAHDGGTSAHALHPPGIAPTNGILLAFAGWHGDQLPYTGSYDSGSAAAVSMTLVPGSQIAYGGGGSGQPAATAFYVLDPVPTDQSGAGYNTIGADLGGTWKSCIVASGVDQTNPIAQVVTASGSSAAPTSSLSSVAGRIYAHYLFVLDTNDGSGAPSGSGLQGVDTTVFAGAKQQIGHGLASVTWTLPTSRQWVTVGVALRGEGSTVENVGDSSDVGDDSGVYAPIGHTHGHGTFNAGDYHSEYVREAILTTAGDLPYATGASAWTRRAIGASNTILASDGSAPVWAARDSGGGSLSAHDHTGAGDGGDLTGSLVSNFMELTEQAASPSSPAAGKVRFFASNLNLYQRDSGGTVTRLSGSGGGGGGISGIVVEEDGAEEGTDITRLNFTTNLDVSVAGAEATISASGGGGSGLAESFGRYDAAAAPGSPSAQDDEFEDSSIGGGLTRVNSGTTYGSYAEKYSGITFHQTANWGANGLDVYMQARTISVGDYVEIAGRAWITDGRTLGPTLGFSDGTTFGTSEAVACFWHATGATNRFMLNTWTNLNSRVTDGTIFDHRNLGLRYYVRVKYEAANTWGLYVSPNGHQWHTVQSNYASTLTPTHVFFGVSAITNNAAAPNWMEIEYFRVNAT